MGSGWVPGGFRISTSRVPVGFGLVPGGLWVGSTWVPGGFQVGSRWFPGWFQVGSGLVPGLFQVCSRWVPGFVPGGFQWVNFLGSSTLVRGQAFWRANIFWSALPLHLKGEILIAFGPKITVLQFPWTDGGNVRFSYWAGQGSCSEPNKSGLNWRVWSVACPGGGQTETKGWLQGVRPHCTNKDQSCTLFACS